MVSLGTEKKFFPGTLGTFAKILLGDEEADLDTVIHDGAHITIIPGENGTTPTVRLGDLVTAGQEYTIYVNGREKHIRQHVTINGKEASADQLLADGDVIESREFKSLGEALLAAGYPPTGRKIHYKLNGSDSSYSCTPEILLNDAPASISMPIHEGDHIEYIADEEPKLGDVLDVNDADTSIVIYYENNEYQIPSASIELMVNGRKASPGTLIDDGCEITYVKSERTATTVSDALLAVNFQPPAATSRMTFTILVNGLPVDFTDPVKNGDILEVKLTSLDKNNETPAAPAASTTGVQTLANINASAPRTNLGGISPVTPRPQMPKFTNSSTPAPSAPAAPQRRTIADFIRND